MLLIFETKSAMDSGGVWGFWRSSCLSLSRWLAELVEEFPTQCKKYPPPRKWSSLENIRVSKVFAPATKSRASPKISIGWSRDYVSAIITRKSLASTIADKLLSVFLRWRIWEARRS